MRNCWVLLYFRVDLPIFNGVNVGLHCVEFIVFIFMFSLMGCAIGVPYIVGSPI